ncbi:MAG: hypothetical protein JKY34_01140 [Kordiimonadaceae bacterium]|nr:hypothetical protein [Kordiimonadaceae bacterium]
MNLAYAPNIEIKYLTHLSQCRDIKSFVQTIKSMLEKMGFAHFGISRLDSTGVPEAPVETVSQDLFNSYFEGGFYTFDLMVDAIRQNNLLEPFYRSKILSFLDTVEFKTDLFDQNHEISKLLSSYGYHDLIIIAEPAANSQGSVLLTLSAKTENLGKYHQLFEECKVRLRMLLRAIDFIGTKNFGEFWIPAGESTEVNITPKTLELVTLMAEHDLRVDAAAYKLGKSVSTCNKQIMWLKDEFKVSTIQGLTHRLIKLGFIKI